MRLVRLFSAIRSFCKDIRSHFEDPYENSAMTDAAKSVMRHALRAARQLNHEYIGVEHLVLGVLFCDSPQDVPLARGRITPGPEMLTLGRLPQTSACTKAIVHATDLADSENEPLVDIQHLRAGILLAEPQTVVWLTGVDPTMPPSLPLQVSSDPPKDPS